MFILTGDILKQIAPSLTLERANKIADIHTKVCPEYGIDTADKLHEFLARELVECGEFSKYVENLNYSVKGLLEIFGKRMTIQQANQFGRIDGVQKANQEAIANIVYGGEWGKRNLGNTQPNDGWDLRGSGAIQITGRAMVQGFASYMLKKYQTNNSLKEWANLLRTVDLYAISSACWVFAISKQLIDEAVDDKMDTIIKSINGGYVGKAETLKYYEKCKQLIKDN